MKYLLVWQVTTPWGKIAAWYPIYHRKIKRDNCKTQSCNLAIKQETRLEDNHKNWGTSRYSVTCKHFKSWTVQCSVAMRIAFYAFTTGLHIPLCSLSPSANIKILCPIIKIMNFLHIVTLASKKARSQT